MSRRAPRVVLALSLALCVSMPICAVRAGATPVVSKDAALPPGSELHEELLNQPTELFATDLAGGRRSYLLNLGDMLFSSSAIFGGKARDAGMSCNSCHQQGAGNAQLFVPGLSSRPGTFDTTSALFNPRTDNGVFDPVTVPSLRGAKNLGPYGHDGRFASLRDFVRNVVVNEFAGAEPSAETLDALVAYINDISFLPNSKLGPGGALTAQASDSARRGEAVFNRPFPHDAATSCATCHVKDSGFVDHRVHDIGTGGLFKSKTLVNAKFNAPYFHDGRFDDLDQVVGYFDKHYDLSLDARDRADLVAYLDAIGDADEPFTPNTVTAQLAEIATFVSVLDTAIPAHNREVIALTVASVGAEWREMGDMFPGRTDTSVEGGLDQRLAARSAVRDVVLTLRQIAMAAETGDFDAAAGRYAEYRRLIVAATEPLKTAERWSLFNPAIHDAHFGALKKLAELAAQ